MPTIVTETRLFANRGGGKLAAGARHGPRAKPQAADFRSLPTDRPANVHSDLRRQRRVRPVAVEENVRLARDTYRLRFACPEIARRVVPGQFVMLRLAGCNDPLLGRALAVYDVVDGPDGRPRRWTSFTWWWAR